MYFEATKKLLNAYSNSDDGSELEKSSNFFLASIPPHDRTKGFYVVRPQPSPAKWKLVNRFNKPLETTPRLIVSRLSRNFPLNIVDKFCPLDESSGGFCGTRLKNKN